MSLKHFQINHIESTSDLITNRAGLAPFHRYLEKTGLLKRLGNDFSSIKGSSKGLKVHDFFNQMICWLMDGTSRHISYFNELKKDDAYGATIETMESDMASSYAIERMCDKFTKFHEPKMRDILLDYCISLMKIKTPAILEFSVDSMVMSNEYAKQQQGRNSTYKTTYGYHPMQIVWNGLILDGIFRSGEKPTNEISKTFDMIDRLVKRIRKEFGDSITMIFRLDGGYYDQRIVNYFDDQNIAFILSGKMFNHVKEAAEAVQDEQWQEYQNGKVTWNVCDLGLKSKSWSRFYRGIYTQQMSNEEGQFILDFARSSNVIITNIGVNPNVLKNLTKKSQKEWTQVNKIVSSHHGRGADELPHRALKDLGFESLPFQQFNQNMVVYQCMVLTLAVFEGFKRNVLSDVISVKSYASTIRRIFFDIAGKICKHSNSITLKLRESVIERFHFSKIWERCCAPPFKID
jgi:hypothetical protein